MPHHLSSAAASRKAWITVFCASMILTLSMGVRQGFGLFLQPVSVDLGIGREAFGLAVALQNLLWGVAQPFVGALADRYGAGWLAAAGAALYVAGLLAASSIGSAFGLHLSVGVMVGLSLTTVTFGVMLGAVGRFVPPEKRSLAFGITAAGGSLGQFLVVPGAQALLEEVGWRMAFTVLAAVMAVAIVLALGVAGRSETREGGESQSISEALREAGASRDYKLLVSGYFVCGLHLAFIGTHLPAYLTDSGLPPSTGATALALVGLFNIFGSYLFGVWGGRWRKNMLLAGIYFARTLAIVAFLLAPVSVPSALVFASVMGFLWLGTVPLTSGLVSGMFGVRYLSTLFGIVFFSHQVGSFFGAWAAGYAYDLFGSYDMAWLVAIAFGLAATLIHLPIREIPAARLSAAE